MEEIMNTALLFVGHGSRDCDGMDELRNLVRRFGEHLPDRIVEPGFLQFGRPNIQEGIDRCVERGAQSVVALPGMLTAARHVKKDIPRELRVAGARYPRVVFHCARHLSLHAKLLELCRIRIEEAHGKKGDRQDTSLLVVGRGSSDPEATAEVGTAARWLGESLGVASSACFASVARPSLTEAFERCQDRGVARIIVFSFLLCTGVLEKRIRATTLDFTQRYPQTEFLYAGYLNAHPLLFDAFAERADEAPLAPSPPGDG